ncbi:MAG: hypothetical protein FDX21_04920 [Chlorobium sp.]|nr:MAG: hypothetical protein FDX21_04920 [Chlorobium sp.]
MKSRRKVELPENDIPDTGKGDLQEYSGEAEVRMGQLFEIFEEFSVVKGDGFEMVKRFYMS